MKKILLTSLIAAAAAVPAFAGIDNLNYQAVIKNGNTILTDQAVTLKFELLDQSNKVVYTEEQKETTSNTGMVSCQIGKDGDLTTIEWGDLSLRVSIDLGSGYEVISTETISSVPTALYALRSADSDEIKEVVEGLMMDNENTQETLRGVNAQLAGLEGFIEDVEIFNQRISDEIGPMMGLNYDEISDFNQRVSDELTRINETLELMQGTDLKSYVDQLEILKADLEAKLKDLSEFSNAVADVQTVKKEVAELNTNTEAFADMVGFQIDKLQKQVETLDDQITPAVEELVQDNETNKETILGINAELVRIGNLAEANEKAIADNLASYQEDFQAMSNTSEGMSNAINELQKEVKENLANYQEDFQAMSETSAGMSNAINDLTKLVQDLQAKIVALEAEIKTLKGE